VFKVECFIDDKHLAKVMHGLDGLVVDLRVVPVRNAVKKNGKLQSSAASSALEAIMAYARQAKLTVITAKQIQDAMKSYGFSPQGYSTAIATAKKAKVLKKGKGSGEYVIVTKEG